MAGNRRGNDRENKVGDHLEATGWIVGSRRHRGGAGDLIASRNGARWGVKALEPQVFLIEVKSTAGGPYERFGPAAREEMKVAAKQAGAEAWLYWWAPRQGLKCLHSSVWPK